MKITEADVLWVPADSGDADAGDICVRRHGSHRRAVGELVIVAIVVVVVAVLILWGT